MDLSVVLFTSDRGITPADAAKGAEEAGFHAFYVPEHSHIPTSRDSAHPGTGGELPDDLDPRVQTQQGDHPGADDGVVVDHHDADRGVAHEATSGARP